ncbi:MAG TPA: ATP-dependent DNA helicase [Kosmotogaceae bacterium]|nr:ATP-dependent DNA helicase [Kosmotogaceae bacterium]
MVCLLQNFLEIYSARTLSSRSKKIEVKSLETGETRHLFEKEIEELLDGENALLFCDDERSFAKLKRLPDCVNEDLLRLCFSYVAGSVETRVRYYLSAMKQLTTDLVALVEDLLPSGEAVKRFLIHGISASVHHTSWQEHVCSKLQRIRRQKRARKQIDLSEATKLVFAENGLLEGIHETYEFRQEQLQTAMEIAESITLDKGILLESGTGTGKTLAYLVPVAYHVLSSGRRAVVSTRTRTLQDQLMQKDVQIMRKLPELDDTRICSLKGRERYLCPSRLIHFMNSMLHQSPIEERSKEALALLLWSLVTPDADLDRMRVTEGIRNAVSSNRFDCLSRLCADRTRCPYYIARENAKNADIVITSHSLLSSEIQMRTPESDIDEGILLPRFEIMVIDEAHGFEKALTDSLTFTLSSGEVMEVTNEASRISEKIFTQDIRTFEESFMESLKVRLSELRKAIDLSAKKLHGLINQHIVRSSMALDGDELARIRQALQDLESFLRGLSSIVVQLNEVYEEELLEHPSLDSVPYTDKLRVLKSRVFELIRHVSGICHNDNNRITYVTPSEVPNNPRISSSPIGNDALVSETLNTIPIKIFISATMWVFSRGSDGFNYSRRILGLQDDFHALKLGTSFDFGKQLRLMLADDMPEYYQNSDEYLDSGASFIRDVLNIVGGGSAVLFTSYNDMEYVVSKIHRDLKSVELKVQSRSESASVMLAEHSISDKSVIFGTQTLWEGIDLPGDKLKLLIIFKLPFDRPDEPITRARIGYYGQNSFMEGLYKYYYPKMITMFRQGIGRVIRTKDDHGVVIVLDKRIADSARNYSVKLLNSLPVGLAVERASKKKILATLRNLKKTKWLT